MHGERLEILKEAAERVHEADTTVEAGEIFGEITGWIVGDTALAAGIAAAGTAFAIGFRGPDPDHNRHKDPQRQRYRQTAGRNAGPWVCTDRVVVRRPNSGVPFLFEKELQRCDGPGGIWLQRVEPALKEASGATVRNLEAKVLKRGRSKMSYQLFWQGIAEGDRKKLVRMLMDTGGAELGAVKRMSFLGLDPDRYPN